MIFALKMPFCLHKLFAYFKSYRHLGSGLFLGHPVRLRKTIGKVNVLDIDVMTSHKNDK